MKKAILSLSAMALAGVVLASCGMSSGAKISAPKKGKSVDKVEFSTSSSDYSIKSDDKFEDVYDLLNGSFEFTYKNPSEGTYEGAYTVVESNKISQSIKNTVYEGEVIADNLKYNAEITNYTELYYKYTYGDNTASETQYYDAKTTEKSQITVDKSSISSSSTVTEKEAGSYSSNYSTRENKVDSGCLEIVNSKVYKKGKFGSENNSESTKVYKYLNASEKPGDDDYGATFYGYDKSGNRYSYSINSFFEYKYLSSPDNYDMYDEDYKDLFECSFELTDKYIILKSKTTFIETIFDQFINDFRYDHSSYTQEEALAGYKDYYNKYHKGSTLESEIWINYTNKDYDNDTYLTSEYFKKTENNKTNMSIEYNEKYFNIMGISEKFQDGLKGKKYSAKGSYYYSIEGVANTNDYSKKIESTKKEMKKNNIFEGITFKTAY